MRARAVPLALAAAVLLGAASPMPLLSHRAQYEVTLAPGGVSREIAGVRGLMVSEFRESCGGYAETQRFVADLTDVDDHAIRTDYSSATWESADGGKFDFTIADAVVGNTAEHYQGHAEATAEGGSAVFTVPAGVTITLPKDTLFPVEFSEHLIAAAGAGETNFAATIFQGDDPKRLSYASAFIGREETTADAELSDVDAMHGVRSWPVVISYFPVDSPDAAADFEITFRLYENGVATGLRMRYANFSLAGRLVKLDVLAASCEGRTGQGSEGRND